MSLRCHAPPPGRANARPMTGSGGASSTPRLLDSITGVSGILGRPVKPGDDIRRNWLFETWSRYKRSALRRWASRFQRAAAN